MIRTLALAAAALTLAACDGGAGTCKAPTSEAKIASKTPPPPPSTLRPDQEGYGRELARASVEDAKTCVQRYAWKLRKADEKTETLAEAVVTACDPFVAAVTQAEQAAYGARDLNAAHDANRQAMTRWATLYLVQYRAGVCD